MTLPKASSLLAAAGLLAATGCSSYRYMRDATAQLEDTRSAYVINNPGNKYNDDIVQGRVRPGMSRLQVRVTWGDPDQAQAILTATVDALRQEAPAYFGRLGLEEPQINLFDGPGVNPVPPSLTQRLDLPVRLLLALVAGVALCFLLDYLDDSVRSRQELEGMGIHVLAEVPTRRRWSGR